MVNSIKGISLKDIKIKKEDENKLDLKMFSRINFESKNENPKKNEDKIYIIRNKLIKYFLNKKIIILLIAFLVLITYFTSFEIGGIYLVLVTMTYTFLIYYPQIKEKNSYSDLNQELPYALRHMSIELKSGKGLHDTMLTIKNSNYGSLSKEFTRVLEEIKFGKQTEESLQEMSHRVNSEGLSRTIHQIIGTLRVGGNLANSLDIIAKDISFETQIKLKEYSQKLNSFILIYTFIAILAPVIILIMLMAGSTVMGDVISGNLLILVYSLFFPLVVMMMGITIKKLEPKI
ncbi:type II secretion system F family protein [Methanobrevibacter sp.]|uniref:type II secretion system F family protein n=1 Tax=Methanobrevibacter sp. TaxID=66852 RepID=UPI002E79F666|nr:type II secretion system F family protein [Methanobrevibacter sp.]MEE0938667.1 type II secretion system F family protein [Methanobrevibacter sp.]